MTKQIGLLALLALGFIACNDETVESEDIRTAGIYATFDALATGNGKTTVSSQLRVGGKGGTLIVLTGEDKVACTTGETKKTLAKSGDYYKSTFVLETGNAQFTFAFNRGDENESAPNSVVSLPEPFVIAGVEATQEVSRAGSVTVTWEPSTVKDAATWELDGDCLFQTHGSVPTDGTLMLTGKSFDSTAVNTADEESCVATLCIERTRQGTLDAVFADEEGGEITATQRRCVKFISTP